MKQSLFWKQTVAKIDKFLAFYETLKLIIVFTIARRCRKSKAR